MRVLLCLCVFLTLVIEKNFVGARGKRPTRCKGATLFTCSRDPLECVSKYVVCDGKADCQNGADEDDFCKTEIQECPEPYFSCLYGACISGALKCDGKPDCYRDHSDELDRLCANTTLNRIDDNGTCDLGHWACKTRTASGATQCIKKSNVCDGPADCDDKSDETHDVCFDVYCPKEAYFQCSYGACISMAQFCNNVTDCIDGSDEDSKKCAVVWNPPNSGRCTLLKLPGTTFYRAELDKKTGEWKKKEDIVSDQFSIKEHTHVGLQCDAGYDYPTGISRSQIYVCQSSRWNPQKPRGVTYFNLEGFLESPHGCTKKCPPLENESMKFDCSFAGDWVNCNQPAEPKTMVDRSCKPFFVPPKRLTGFETSSRCLSTGDWEPSNFECIPDCGRSPINDNYTQHTPINDGDFPWHAFIYLKDDKTDDYLPICSGSVISPFLIVTAAHCVVSANKKTIKTQFLKVGVGKMVFDLTGSLNKSEQMIDVDRVVTREKLYYGSKNNYGANIAVLVLKNNIFLNENAQLICVNWDLNAIKFRERLTKGQMVTFEDSSVQLTSFLYSSCYNHATKDYVEVADKICAVTENSNEASFDERNGGSGFFIRGHERYYLHGIFSKQHSQKNNYVAFTSLTVHINWLKRTCAEHSQGFTKSICSTGH